MQTLVLLIDAGLETARLLLEPLTAKYPKISRADIWTLAGAVAIESMGCPAVAWRPGRVDFNPSDNTGATSGKCPVSGKSVGKCPASGNVGGSSGGFIPPNGRLPDAALGAAHLRTVFNRMGFNDQEIVALSGAHSLGRCHTDRSGYSGPWTYTPNKLGNQYFKLLLSVKWQKKKWDGPEQFVDPTDSIMMLPTDMCLLSDPDFKKHVQLYADNKDAFLKDFSRVFAKLMELGVPRPRI